MNDFKPFNLQEISAVNFFSSQPPYSNIKVKTLYPLYKTYKRQGRELIGVGKRIGYLGFVVGTTWGGCPPCNIGRYRRKVTALILNENSEIYQLANQVGIENLVKPFRFNHLTATTYTFAYYCKNKQVSIGLLGNDGSYIDLPKKWTQKEYDEIIM